MGEKLKRAPRYTADAWLKFVEARIEFYNSRYEEAQDPRLLLYLRYWERQSEKARTAS